MKILNGFVFPQLFVLFWIFFKIGLIFFGGGYVAIPLIHKELVTSLHLLTEQEFIDGMAISQLTPGPIAILATFAGYCIYGFKGALVSTFAAFLPGISLMLFLSKKYEKIKNSIFAYKVLNYMLPIIVGLLVATSYQIGKSTMNSLRDFFLFFLSLILLVRFKINPAILIICSLLLGLIFHNI